MSKDYLRGDSMKLVMKTLSLVICLLFVSDVGLSQQKKMKKKKKAPAMSGSTDGATEESSSGASSGGYRMPAYGMAGCGLGGYAVGRNTKMAQLGATSLNAYSYNQSFAITSGTSHCDRLPTDVVMLEQEVFVTSNYASLSREAAQGHGEHLVAFAELLGCNESGEMSDAFAKMSQRHYAEIFSGSDAKEVLSDVKRVIHSDATLSGNCSRTL
jgi:hypothetical protein